MSSTTPNLNLVKLVGTDNFSNANALAGNWDKIDTFAGTVNPKKTTTISAISSDDYILGLENGNYKVALNSASAYLPEQWGTLEVSKTGASGSAPYGTATFTSTSGKLYVRPMKSASEWFTVWQQIALNSQLTQSYYNMNDTSTNAIGLIRFAGNKIAILSFTNQSGQISSSGLQLPYTFKDDISTICQYYNGSSNDYGQLMLSKTGLVQIRKSGQFVNATYVLGQITACLA